MNAYLFLSVRSVPVRTYIIDLPIFLIIEPLLVVSRTKPFLSWAPSARVGYGVNQAVHYMTSEYKSVSRTTLTERRILIK
ncbi:hypothetical protein ANCCAN_24802 [Ancylostoma caninum]|uniref:Uncharacterized protein n=1 Tax=Ancylostoma caninum TaxID=29170 RepID=A0A368FEJ1_ANCCA|nr:hypothetical protein ANCCAN_24802 [Ancylostoma caninum]